jgi:molybdopterin-binding protein
MLYNRNRSDPERTKKAEGSAMRLSARNQLKGTVVDVIKGATTAHVRIDVGGAILTASITNEAVDELKLASGQTAIAVVKATDVIVGVED